MSEKINQTEILILLHNIDDRLKEILQILKMQSREMIHTEQLKALKSPLRKSVYELSNGQNSVGDIAKQLNKSMQQISNNIALLEEAGLIKEVRSGKEKKFVKTR
jgi:DNA-binding transcriptional ArsR family regulator